MPTIFFTEILWPRHVVLLKDVFALSSDQYLTSRQTPNAILQTTDVPDRCQRHIEPNVSYPTNSRYMLQWVVIPKNRSIQDWFLNNNDATFIDQQLLQNFYLRCCSCEAMAETPVFWPIVPIFLPHQLQRVSSMIASLLFKGGLLL